eukprot:CAMPEP_0195038700 /NCGR_PEP_ID=MMETSP0326_2-20130528/78066_1 /TAXON_ID=2866 ORGANISM="Crypthecodinium cohnii, Strain Seligo" /NCGR_SAMPLE_ID=MMETSP0326_2 /ASSEMBLY_ACC=CAM_ASM_000348 /LENGTH=48 /DNA_ID= /DNA_START= /DNA_END= /DNA_ORIENTATION=
MSHRMVGRRTRGVTKEGEGISHQTDTMPGRPSGPAAAPDSNLSPSRPE